MITSIHSTDLSFNYNTKTEVFNNHSINLEVDSSQERKLYGIIGPSGTGKTTLVSILGGQLKPTTGQITICGTDIYAVNDLVRRSLITMQMQTATSLRGKLRYNMLFGLPEEVKTSETYSDDYLIEILKMVGLWNLFKDKDQLNTLIGEGGINLSGGQRQRLNFAGLYLRSKHFQPKIILIDEPTSSLDEVSERAITQMILEMSGWSLTLVVAHRLKTLDEATAILDTSLVDSQKSLNFYTREELTQSSAYYQDLMAGKALLDD